MIEENNKVGDMRNIPLNLKNVFYNSDGLIQGWGADEDLVDGKTDETTWVNCWVKVFMDKRNSKGKKKYYIRRAFEDTNEYIEAVDFLKSKISSSKPHKVSISPCAVTEDGYNGPSFSYSVSTRKFKVGEVWFQKVLEYEDQELLREKAVAV